MNIMCMDMCIEFSFMSIVNAKVLLTLGYQNFYGECENFIIVTEEEYQMLEAMSLRQSNKCFLMLVVRCESRTETNFVTNHPHPIKRI